MKREIFGTLHIEVQKDIDVDNIFEDIANILDLHGYICVGEIGITEFAYEENCKKPLPSDVAHEAYMKHHKKIENAW